MTGPRVRTVTAAALRAQPLPAPGGDKEQRGRVLIVGGSARVPGAVMLAGEAALRAGAGKLQLATAASVAPGMALAMPEALVLGLGENGQGEIVRGHRALDAAMSACDAAVIGPGMASTNTTAALSNARSTRRCARWCWMPVHCRHGCVRPWDGPSC